MKAKTILSSLVLLTFAILGGGSVETVNIILIGFLVIVGGLILLGVVWGIGDIIKSKEGEETKRLEREAKIAEYNAQKEHFLAINGTPDKSIIINEFDLNSEIHVYESTKKVFIMGKEYFFNDVMSCTVSSRDRIERGNVTAITESSNGSIIGRAVVGDIVAGPVGAIIGGSTAKQQTEYIHGDDRVVHNYTVNITMNSISEPNIRINTGERPKLTNEIISLMNVIIARK